MADRPVLEDERSLPCVGLSSPDGDTSALAARYRLLAKHVGDFVENGADFVFRKHALLDQGFEQNLDESDGGEPVFGCSNCSEITHYSSSAEPGDRPVEIEITPQMIEAGEAALFDMICDEGEIGVSGSAISRAVAKVLAAGLAALPVLAPEDTPEDHLSGR